MPLKVTGIAKQLIILRGGCPLYKNFSSAGAILMALWVDLLIAAGAKNLKSST